MPRELTAFTNEFFTYTDPLAIEHDDINELVYADSIRFFHDHTPLPVILNLIALYNSELMVLTMSLPAPLLALYMYPYALELIANEPNGITNLLAATKYCDTETLDKDKQIIKLQMWVILSKLREWSELNQLPNAAKWDNLCQLIYSRAWVSANETQWFSQGKALLEKIYVHLVRSATLAHQQKKALINSLLADDSILVCAPGVIDNLSDCLDQLAASENSQQLIKATKTELVKQAGAIFISSNDSRELHIADEVHVVNALTNALSSELGLEKIADILIPTSLTSNLNMAESQLKQQFLNYCKEEVLTVDNVITSLCKYYLGLVDADTTNQEILYQQVKNLELMLSKLGADEDFAISRLLIDTDEGYILAPQLPYIITQSIATRLHSSNFVCTAGIYAYNLKAFADKFQGSSDNHVKYRLLQDANTDIQLALVTNSDYFRIIFASIHPEVLPFFIARYSCLINSKEELQFVFKQTNGLSSAMQFNLVKILDNAEKITWAKELYPDVSTASWDNYLAQSVFKTNLSAFTLQTKQQNSNNSAVDYHPKAQPTGLHQL